MHRAVPGSQLVFRQLFDQTSCTYTYLIGDRESGDAAIIDPVLSHTDRDLELLEEVFKKPNLRYAVNTHVHADHLTATGRMKKRIPDLESVLGAAGNEAAKADVKVAEGNALSIGRFSLTFLHTPGHTQGCHTLVLKDDADRQLAFTGDTLLIRGCGRTDFQGGSSDELYDSVQQKIFTLDEDTILLPAHDYRGRTMSTVCEEKRYNPRLSKDKATFKSIMANLNLQYPKQIDRALPFNMLCGLHEVPGE
ncbi:Hydroxyacylglutathione hydrolase, mitochondrial [Hondaea fermentalgiana]|uniref:persulfide dioxygenase n=1 Tax=Hondaea fermentalgiana TaxID=2315210 RepID=A0A2R5GCA6_9STRA|nr:Hydroxyacylglutathione hydrolase, mitochondrial [Hondaea fermentalgiana]|eukprot:GBG25791.1 Hydroxyacylglutathione hydrolase, mitochondrial [Hondaea fermentalgiana]